MSTHTHTHTHTHTVAAAHRVRLFVVSRTLMLNREITFFSLSGSPPKYPAFASSPLPRHRLLESRTILREFVSHTKAPYTRVMESALAVRWLKVCRLTQCITIKRKPRC